VRYAFCLNQYRSTLWWVNAHLCEEQIFTGVFAVAPACYQPVLQSSTEQWGMHSASTSAAVPWWWVPAHLYEEQIFIGFCEVAPACYQPGSAALSNGVCMLPQPVLLQICMVDKVDEDTVRGQPCMHMQEQVNSMYSNQGPVLGCLATDSISAQCALDVSPLPARAVGMLGHLLLHHLLGKLLSPGIKGFSRHLHSFLGDLHWMIVLQNFVQV